MNSMRMSTHSSYPPYNITKMDRDTIKELGLGIADNVQEQVKIELAVAGFKREELQIEQKENVLSVSGRTEPSDEDDYITPVVTQNWKA